MRHKPQIVQGDCLDVMRDMPADCIDLIMSSPPYADARMNTYGGTPPDDYLNWFMPIAEQMKRVIKPSGSIVINIKEGSIDGTRHPYVLRLALAMIDDLGMLLAKESSMESSGDRI